MNKANIGLIGLAVMGQNLVLNMNDHGFKVAFYNRASSKVDDFINGPAKEAQIIGTRSIEELTNSLESPRIVMLMVKAGAVVDQPCGQFFHTDWTGHEGKTASSFYTV